MRKEKRGQSFECGIGNAECGKKKEDRVLNAELGMRNAEFRKAEGSREND
jgi:hypothetical protein